MLLVQWQCISTTTTTTTSTTTTTKSTSSNSCANTTISLNGKCPDTNSFSPYEPTYLTNSTSTSFGYPIYQEIVCENSVIVLKCPTNLVLHIYAAYYGVQTQTSTETCRNSTGLESGTFPTMCYIWEGFKIVNASCEYQNVCKLRVTTTILGGPDLYPSIGKQLLIQVTIPSISFISSYS